MTRAVPKLELKCAQCGVSFFRQRSAQQFKRTFCGLPCAYKWRTAKRWEETRGAESSERNKALLSVNRRGAKHPGWKGGINWKTYRKMAFVEHGKPKKCQRCGSVRFVEVHHRNGNYLDLSFENLEVICRACHNAEHHRDWGTNTKKKTERLAARGF